MSEWLKEHAWKATRASITKQYRDTSIRNQFNGLRLPELRRCEAVNVGVDRWFDPLLTQFLHSFPFDLRLVDRLDEWRSWSHITSMALARKKATTIALDPEDDRLLSRAARERGVSRSEFIRQHLALVLEQYRRHPKPRSAGIVRGLTERGDERELFSAGR
jgi:Arc/MetJ-type ribon-helix-helix transcriptional regulator